MPVFNDVPTFLQTAAEAYLAHGYSVIPLWGDADPERAKVAAVDWKDFQRRRATLDELDRWFASGGYPALAIITGRISSLAVLDFDSEAAFHDFGLACPDLVERHVIKTRRGCHIYFHVPPHLGVPGSRKFPGGDWLWEGRYAVARPTTIARFEYRLLKGGEPKPLNTRDVERISSFFRLLDLREGQPTRLSDPAVVAPPPPPPSLHTPVSPSLIASPSPLSAYMLLSRYRYLASQIGRNEALFRVSLQARDRGWTIDDAITTLADAHARQPAVYEHVPESESQRRKEAVATIFSAFSRPACPVVTVQTGKGLPNSVVEALYSLGLTCVVRVLNALREQGITPDTAISYTQAHQRLQATGIGDWSLRQAFHARLPDGERVFTPLTTPPAPNGAAGHTDHLEYQKNAFLVGCQTQQKLKPHRPPSLYRLPSNEEMCVRLGVPLTRTDPLTAADFASARAVRQASLRELIKRRPGKYSNRWHAQRLGISVRTLQRYKTRIKDLQVIPTFTEIPLYWGNLNVVPDTNDIGGAFLEDDHGHRYPALRPLAAALLKRGREVIYKRQDVDFYCFGNPEIVALQVRKPNQIILPRAVPVMCSPSPPSGNQPPPRNITKTKVVSLNYRLTVVGNSSAPASPAAPASSARPKPSKPRPPKRVSKRHYRRPLSDPNHEALAQGVYSTINDATAERAYRISLVTARRCVDRYGTEMVEGALRLMASRRNITKPVGFFMTVLRCEAKFRSANQQKWGI